MRPLYSGHKSVKVMEPVKVVHLKSLFDCRFYYCRALHDVNGGTRATEDTRSVTCRPCLAALDARLAKYDKETP